MNHNDMIKKDFQDTYKQNEELKAGMIALSKEARRVLVKTNVWQQEFDGQEVLSIIAMYQATKSLVYRQEAALSIAVECLRKCSDWKSNNNMAEFELEQLEPSDVIEVFGECIEIVSTKALEEINQALMSITVEQSINKRGK